MMLRGCGVRATPLDADNRAAFELLLRETWSQNRWHPTLARQVVQWRYTDRPDRDTAVTWLAMDGDRCVAMIDCMTRRYLLDGKLIQVRETADWYATQEARRSAAGLTVLMQLLRRSEPIVVLGG